MTNKAFIFVVVFFMSVLGSCKKQEVPPPQAFGVVPSASQLEWQKLEYYMFIHFGPNTFTDKEWGDGKEDPKVFNPSGLDCRQWAATAKAAGMKAIIITAKHHDGFCLWPSQYSTHTVRESAWKNGEGDLLKELSDACREFDLKFGVYLSPWDQNHPEYGTLGYNQIFANTLTEVLTGYGDVFEQWFDGANGEGEGGKKQAYDWALFNTTVLEHQPDAIIFSDIGPGCRWIGNEQGFSGETNWSRLNVNGFEPGRLSPPLDTLNQGNMFGTAWVPGEADVSIRPGWFYSPSTDDKVKTLEQLLDIYYASVGRNSNLLLNVPPDRRGLIHPNDSIRLMELRQSIDEIFKVNLVQKANISASSTRGSSARYDASKMMDGNYDTYWATDDDMLTGFVTLEFKQPETFNRLMIQEYIALGQRVAEFNVQFWNNESASWETLAEATTIGYKRILRFPTVTTSKVKVNILKSLASPVLNNIGLYNASEDVALPIIERNRQGDVFISCNTNNTVLYYTTDGTEPTAEASVFTKPFSLPRSGSVKAIAILRNGAGKSEVVTHKFDISPLKWRVVTPPSLDAENAIDGKSGKHATIDKSEAMIIDLGEKLQLKGFFYNPVNSENAANILRYNFYVSMDGVNWLTVKTDATFSNIKNNPIRQNVRFDKPVNAKFIMIESLETGTKSNVYLIDEIGVLTD